MKPFGTENEHPGYASEPDGSDHLVDLLKAIEDSACAKDTMVIVTYDEFGGQWDHVRRRARARRRPARRLGPGNADPGAGVAPHLKGDFVVDSAEHDTTSILATLEHRYGLEPLGTRDAAVFFLQGGRRTAWLRLRIARRKVRHLTAFPQNATVLTSYSPTGQSTICRLPRTAT